MDTATPPETTRLDALERRCADLEAQNAGLYAKTQELETGHAQILAALYEHAAWLTALRAVNSEHPRRRKDVERIHREEVTRRYGPLAAMGIAAAGAACAVSTATDDPESSQPREAVA